MYALIVSFHTIDDRTRVDRRLLECRYIDGVASRAQPRQILGSATHTALNIALAIDAISAENAPTDAERAMRDTHAAWTLLGVARRSPRDGFFFDDFDIRVVQLDSCG